MGMVLAEKALAGLQETRGGAEVLPPGVLKTQALTLPLQPPLAPGESACDPA